MTRRYVLMSMMPPAEPAIRLHIGNYGLQALPVMEALEFVRRTGYDGLELCVLAGWPSEPKSLDAGARRRIRESGFPVPTILDGMSLAGTDDAHRASLARIVEVAALAHDIAPGHPPILQTVLGGKPGEWESAKERMADRLSAWGAAAAQAKVRLAVKAHAFQVVDTPEKLLWLLGRAASPALSAIYDYGHFEARGLEIEPTMDQLLGRSSFITVKDSRTTGGKIEYLLPGDGKVDYGRYFAKVRQMGWRGWVLVEVTRQLQTAPGYDGRAAAVRAYGSMSAALKKAGLRG